MSSIIKPDAQGTNANPVQATDKPSTGEVVTPTVEANATKKEKTVARKSKTFQKMYTSIINFKSAAEGLKSSIKEGKEPNEPSDTLDNLTEMVENATNLLNDPSVIKLFEAVNNLSREFSRTSKAARKRFPDLAASHPKHR